MEQIAPQIVAPVVNVLNNFITKHLRYLISPGKYVTDMTSRWNVLVGKSDDVKTHMDSNKGANKEIPTRVPTWLIDVENVKKDVERISNNDIGCLDMKKRYQVGKNAFEAIKKIESLIDEEKESKWSDANKPLGRVDSKHAPSGKTTQNEFKSRDKAFKDALNLLQKDDKDSQVIALCGMGGVGKTTMMEQLKKVAHDDKMFDYIVKLVIGDNPKMLNVQKDMAVYTGDGYLPEASVSVRADYLCKRFERFSQDEKRILVILDDIWNTIKLTDIGLTSPLPNGVKLLLTSRLSNTCAKVGYDVDSECQELTVSVLEEREAQTFFFRIAGVSEKDDHDKYLIGCDIVEKCAGLPLAIKIVASHLKSKDLYVWGDALNCMHNDDFEQAVAKAIRMSYESIEEDEVKQIFLHCGVFPDDSNIPIEDLVRHAWGLKLFKNVSTLRHARERTRTCVDNLIDANLLMNGDHLGYVKMHDIVLCFVIYEVSKGDHGWIIDHGDAAYRWANGVRDVSCKNISLTCRGLSEFPTNLENPNLSFLQLMDGDTLFKFSEDFYKNMENLKVIAYYEIQNPLLPRSLTNLTTLCLSRCKSLFDCSFVGDLLNLQVLSFAHSDNLNIPSTIGNLKKLKLLDLTGCVDLQVDDDVFINLESLEELYVRGEKSRVISFTKANFEELKVLSSKLCALEAEFVDFLPQDFSFEKLVKFKISIGCTLGRALKNKRSFHNKLKLLTDRSCLLDCKINVLIKKTETLYLQVKGMTCLEDIVPINPYNPFCNLSNLEVSKCADLKYLFPVHVASGLKKLERLKISSCLVLEALVDNDGDEINCVGVIISFEKLKFLCLRNLPKLVSMFRFDNVVKLPQLADLEVDGLPNFTSIYPDKNNNSTSLFNSRVRAPELQELKIKSMKNLKQIWAVSSDEEEVNDISILRDIEVEKCDSMLKLFPVNPMRLLNHLERLTVTSCGSIEEIFNIDMDRVGHEMEQLRSSLRSITVTHSNKVRDVFRIKGGNNKSSLLLHDLEAVESIKIKYCEV